MRFNRRGFHGWALAQLAVAGLLTGRGAVAAPQLPGAGGGAGAAMADLDVLYIPPLFLTGQAPKVANGPQRALASLARLQAQWPGLSQRLLAAWPQDRPWRQVVQQVQGHLAQAQRHAEAGLWPASHEALESVRLDLMKARVARGMDHLLDRYTAFHEPMEVLAGVADAPPADGRLGDARRAQMLQHYAQARALWRQIETVEPAPALWHLSATRLGQWRKAMADESAALVALSDALNRPDDAALIKAAGAIKAPFIRAYTAFGLGEGESLAG